MLEERIISKDLSSAREGSSSLSTLVDFMRDLDLTASFDEIMELGINSVKKLLGVDTAVLMTSQEEVLHLRKYVSDSALRKRDKCNLLVLDECLCGLAVGGKKAVCSLDLPNDTRCTKVQCRRLGIRSFAALPLIDKGRMFGTIGIGSKRERAFEDQGELLEGIAYHFSIALANAKKTERALKDLEERAKLLEISQRNQKPEALGVFAGGIAHDFNNLLGGMIGYIDLARCYTGDARVSGYLDGCVTAVQCARGLTNQLLTFAKGGLPLLRSMSIFTALKESVSLALSGSNVASSFNVEENLWPCLVDREQIGQVFCNIAINAVQAMPAGGMLKVKANNVTFGAKGHASLASGDYVKVSIIDQGDGIPQHILPNIFDPFFTTKSQGQGLGLAICHSIILRHGGAIDVFSELGEGTTFDVYLPAIVQGPLEEVEKHSAPVIHKGRGLVIVMDDEEVMRDVMHDLLETMGYSVTCASDGLEAKNMLKTALAESKEISAMFLDLTVAGGLGGKEIISDLRSLAPTLPIIVMSGYADDPIMAQATRYGFTASIRKPFHREDLEKVLTVETQNGAFAG